MSEPGPIVLREGEDYPSSIFQRLPDDFGLLAYNLCGPPSRLWADREHAPELVSLNVDSARVRHLPTPAQALRRPPDQETWTARSRSSIARLWAHYLIAEDPQRRLDAREVSTLAHQVSLVRHILDSGPHLNRVLIADEVGLGKTVEVGLLVKEWLDRDSRLRILYLAPAKLVDNVRREFDRLGLRFRQWSASAAVDGRLDDARLIASIHRAVHPKHMKALLGAPRWDAIIVDECHHLSDWAPGGGDPVRKFKLVEDLVRQQAPDARLVLLSGTPHQGNNTRFENLLGLLKRDREPDGAMAGRVIYRTKEDVRDWDGRPLFPGRRVEPPVVIDLGPDYRNWIENIHQFFAPVTTRALSMARRRSANWRCAQALQWAASSPQAGLGYLVRQAIRAGWTLRDRPILARALEALRPYRMGPPDESSDRLFERMDREIGHQRQEADLEDMEEFDDDAPPLDQPTLASLLRDGIGLVQSSADEKWSLLKKRILDPAGTEKVVLFAQPIETVTALAGFLERTTGVRPALILGGQDDATREREIRQFRDPSGPQYLVSSRAGGEGINLQVARRLVHVDIPWNPMDMEQRVGRVHRFGSRQTIIVDALVVKDSREADAYRVARQKLEQIAQILGDSERFEALFSRVMALIPPDDLVDIITGTSGTPINGEQERRLTEMVQQGYQSWRDFNSRFAEQQRAIRDQNPGLASWDDLRRFLVELAGAAPVAGGRAHRFVESDPDGRPVAAAVEVPVLKLPDGEHYLAGETDGVPVTGPDGAPPRPMGLNVPAVADHLRRFALSPTATGAAHLRWPGGRPPAPAAATSGVLILLRQTVRPEGSRWVEQGATLHAYHVDESGNWGEWVGEERRAAIRALLGAVLRREPAPDGPLHDALERCEADRIRDLLAPTPAEREARQRPAIVPLLAAIVTP